MLCLGRVLIGLFSSFSICSVGSLFDSNGLLEVEVVVVVEEEVALVGVRGSVVLGDDVVFIATIVIGLEVNDDEDDDDDEEEEGIVIHLVMFDSNCSARLKSFEVSSGPLT
jgi:hypothetical protein